MMVEYNKALELELSSETLSIRQDDVQGYYREEVEVGVLPSATREIYARIGKRLVSTTQLLVIRDSAFGQP